MSYVEDSFLNRESIRRLAPSLRSPVLIVGAGQGILVEELQKQGLEVTGVDFEPRMIENAEKRRGLKLIQSDAADMPFVDRSFKTSVIATGVVDLLSDEEQVKAIIQETQRVTDGIGDVFIAFYQFLPKVEELARNIGTITDKDTWCYRRACKMSSLSIPAQLKTIIKDFGALRALQILLKVQMGLPRKEKRELKRWAKIWKEVKKDLGSIEQLLASTPEEVPYRNEASIKNLCKNFNIPIQKIFIFDSCTVVQV